MSYAQNEPLLTWNRDAGKNRRMHLSQCGQNIKVCMLTLSFWRAVSYNSKSVVDTNQRINTDGINFLEHLTNEPGYNPVVISSDVYLTSGNTVLNASDRVQHPSLWTILATCNILGHPLHGCECVCQRVLDRRWQNVKARWRSDLSQVFIRRYDYWVVPLVHFWGLVRWWLLHICTTELKEHLTRHSYDEATVQQQIEQAGQYSLRGGHYSPVNNVPSPPRPSSESWRWFWSWKM